MVSTAPSSSLPQCPCQNQSLIAITHRTTDMGLVLTLTKSRTFVLISKAHSPCWFAFLVGAAQAAHGGMQHCPTQIPI
jgi:hypothetical protein